MKTIFFSLLLCLILPVSALAAQDVVDPYEFDGLTEEEIIELIEELNPPDVTTLYRETEIDPYRVTFALDVEDQTMRDVVVLVLGDYSPRTQTVTEYLSDGTEVTYTEVIPGLAGLDWEWIGGAALFALALFSFFKIVGVFVKHG